MNFFDNVRYNPQLGQILCSLMINFHKARFLVNRLCNFILHYSEGYLSFKFTNLK